ncbi:DoxX family protein [Emticicia sp. BO119]|uniref:DoxX family protein n=1 Tax=Emticicia sp. BO119 TaxID=2757768 RepID=UPI0015F11809|nr:DoxX family protein [Emticicia sp. BO119]MBA4849266.1 DoxX family protein [Emticicia sp. BO119]
MKTTLILLWVARLVAAIIMLQTLYFKFTAQAESVYIFSTIGLEPWGRIGTGIAELIASILLLIPHTSWLGALMGIGIMAGAIVSHLFLLGIEVMDDGGQLFYMALLTTICCLFVVYKEKATIFRVIKKFA